MGTGCPQDIDVAGDNASGGAIAAAAAVPGTPAPEVYFGGSPTRGGSPITRFVAGAFEPVTSVSGVNVYAGCAGAPGVVGFGGVRTGAGPPVVLRGSR
jgi:hypothetical protein